MSGTVDERRKDHWMRELEQRHPDLTIPSGRGGGGDGGGPHMPDMELLKARVDALETGFGEVKAKLDKVDDRLRGVEGDLREIKGTLNTLTNSVVGKLPTWWQMPAVMGGLLALVGIAIKVGVLHP